MGSPVARSGESRRRSRSGPALGIEMVDHVDGVGGIYADADLLVLRSFSTWRMCR